MNSRPLALLVGLTAAVGACGSATDGRDPTWGYIAPIIIEPNCATSSCHSKGTAAAGLDLSTYDDSYISLRELHLAKRGMDTEKPRPLVTPFNPEESRLMNMLRADAARRMPPDRPLADADVKLIERWILNGASED